MPCNKRLWKHALCASASCGALWLAQPALAQDATDTTDTQEIIVTGTLIRQTVTSSPLSVVNSDDIQARALTNAAELVNTIPSNSGSEAGTDQLGQPLTAGTAQFNLRNLGLGSTLVLVNNRRQTLSAVANNDGSTFVDINSLVPLIAVERVEVIKDGGAATYGSDAVAGVVNFITRKRVDRPEVSARVNFIDGAQQYNLDGIAGFEVAGGDLVVAASYYKSTRLATTKRKFSTASSFGRPWWHSVSSYGQPGSFLPVGGGSYMADPDCTNAAFPDSYQTSPTDLCRFDFSGYYDLIPKEQRIQVFATYNGTIGDNVNLNLEAGYANTKSSTTSSPSFPMLAIAPIVPASHPDNPFGEDVYFRGRMLNGEYGPSITHNNYDTFRLAAGLDGELGKAWNWSLNATYSQQTVFYDKPDTIKTRFINALNGLGGPDCDPFSGTPGVGSCMYFNPFGSAYLGTGTANSDELVQSLIGSTDMHGKTSLITLDAVVSGDLFDLGGETVQAAAGAQYRRSTFRHNWGDLINAGELITLGQAPDFSGNEEVYSVFGELRVPLGSIAEANFSGRYEKYAHSFGRFTPKISLLAHPFDMLSLRASWGKAFRAPGVYQQYAVQAAQPGVLDPALSNAYVFVNTVTYGDKTLDPERSTNWNLGATFTPTRNIELNFDYYNFKYKDLIVKENPQQIINAAWAGDTDAQSRITRDINGNLQRVDLKFINASSVEVEGFDAGARTWFDTGLGRFELKAQWSHVVKYDIQTVAGGPVIDGLGSVNFNNLGHSMPQDRVEYGVYWSSGAHKLNVLGHYVSGYDNDRTATHIKSHNTYDVQYSVALDDVVGLSGTTLSVGAINVFDKAPPVAQLFLGFDPTVHDPRGRVIYVGVNQTF
ncbi:MAG: TonB-dependent receptor [Novosphingobium sp.]|nr:TonB-dependent receptor [Novosphingobium sp.]